MSKRFTWDKPIGRPTREIGPTTTMERLRANKAVRPNKSKLQPEYDEYLRKRRGFSK